MGLTKFNNVGIKALTATVPHRIVKTRELTDFFSKEAIEKFIEATGVEERRFIDSDKCASDLCYQSACKIFDNTNIKPEDIDMLIFVTQMPDYKSPETSVILQNKLGLRQETICYDVNTACTGFIRGLLMGYTFLQLSTINNVLLLAGDTLSKLTSLQDKSTGMLLGDGGMAAVLSKGEQYGESYFSLNTDGAYIDSVLIPAGGSRIMSSMETLQPKKYEDGSIRSLEQVNMQGMDVFSYAISVLPKDIKRLLSFANKDINDIDKFAFHQANNFMTNLIVKKVKADKAKIMHSINKYGNTAGVSIPLTIVENREKINKGDSILMNAIGAGFTYGTVLLNVADCNILEIDEL
ncbi:MAG: ketoacyl-ACP synthase III [Bacteroidales bacterium]|jgi:3-oxoacyl-[acyl-carrier-protein] synthase-3|nr:ketoacyl-ACP synthase III [Bacteroidales bacterium]